MIKKIKIILSIVFIIFVLLFLYLSYSDYAELREIKLMNKIDVIMVEQEKYKLTIPIEVIPAPKNQPLAMHSKTLYTNKINFFVVKYSEDYKIIYLTIHRLGGYSFIANKFFYRITDKKTEKKLIEILKKKK